MLTYDEINLSTIKIEGNYFVNPAKYVNIELGKLYKILKIHGKKYVPALLPQDIKRGELGYCFDNSALAVSKNLSKYHYVEGIAKAKTDKGWILHAWLTDGIRAYDPTWKSIHSATGEERVFPGTYIGISMPFASVVAFMKATGYQGVIANYWRNPSKAGACVGFDLLRELEDFTTNEYQPTSQVRC